MNPSKEVYQYNSAEKLKAIENLNIFYIFLLQDLK